MRVIYRWRVSGQREVFEEAWYRLTCAIRENVPGALGSVLTWSLEDEGRDVAVAIARWESRTAWEDRVKYDPDPSAAAAMSELGSLLTVEVLSERFDLTISDSTDAR